MIVRMQTIFLSRSYLLNCLQCRQYSFHDHTSSTVFNADNIPFTIIPPQLSSKPSFDFPNLITLFLDTLYLSEIWRFNFVHETDKPSLIDDSQNGQMTVTLGKEFAAQSRDSKLSVASCQLRVASCQLISVSCQLVSVSCYFASDIYFVYYWPNSHVLRH